MANPNFKPRPSRIKDIVGLRFGRLIVTSLAHITDSKTYWQCRCDCGKQAIVSKANLQGRTRSCGCYFLDIATKHGHARDKNVSPEYKAWRAAKDRCFNSKNASYATYGGRGITMCEEWRNNFSAFLRDVGPRPSGKHSLDRYPNNNGNYEPSNVRWATGKEQCRNQRKNRIVTANGQSLTVAEWAERLNMNPETIRGRLERGWTHEDIVKPLRS